MFLYRISTKQEALSTDLQCIMLSNWVFLTFGYLRHKTMITTYQML